MRNSMILALQVLMLSACQASTPVEIATVGDTVDSDGLRLSVERTGKSMSISITNTSGATREVRFRAGGCTTRSVVLHRGRIAWDEQHVVRACGDQDGRAILEQGEGLTIPELVPQEALSHLAGGGTLFVAVELLPTPVWIRPTG
jgi:hypothetical protein